MKLSLYSHSPRTAIRVFPVRTQWTPSDDLAFVGEPPALSDRFASLDRALPVLVSVSFTWHKGMAERIAASWRDYFKDVRVGGPAYEDPGDEFTPGLFLGAGCTITSRGCPKKCPWCVVPTREGALRELEIKPGWIVQDNNLLACSERHIREVFDMLREQKRAIFFNGGLDKHFFKDWHRDLFDTIPIGELWFACDVASDLPALERAAKMLDGIPIGKRRCYTMIGFDSETPAEAERRLESVYRLGFLPFCQLHQPDEPKTYGDEWRKVRRKWSRPAAYRSVPKSADDGLFAAEVS